ncbi:envelope integrity protein Cei [Gordonia zhaorongruii]|uniref:envelope integrity protein Cei n=1 Tax=Gordonia zhaorongruii TaxID=2597659 RepID=UPI00104582E1|nr:envelope integrity protein Cei [Gordonia zhaorongruii]
MVSRIATGYTTDAKGRPFLRRNLRPGIIVVTILALVAVAGWIYAFSGPGDKSYPTDCNIAEGSNLSKVNGSDMRNVGPAPLSTFGVRVLNSAAQRGSARSVSDDLAALGYRGAEPAFGDDTVYTERNLHCVAQIRYGEAGQAAAAAVWLVAPCAQLVNDGRPGTDVDLALGEYYTSTQPTQDAQAAIEALRVANPRQKQSPVDSSLLDAVHGQPC